MHTNWWIVILLFTAEQLDSSTRTLLIQARQVEQLSVSCRVVPSVSWGLKSLNSRTAINISSENKFPMFNNIRLILYKICISTSQTCFTHQLANKQTNYHLTCIRLKSGVALQSGSLFLSSNSSSSSSVGSTYSTLGSTLVSASSFFGFRLAFLPADADRSCSSSSTSFFCERGDFLEC